MKNTMHLMVGPTGCGKSTYRKRHLSKLPCVSPDDFIIGKFTHRKRFHAWAHAQLMAIDLLEGGESFVMDSQFIDPAVRREWFALASGFGYTVRSYVFLTPWQQILRNHKKRGDRGGYGRIPYATILEFYQAFMKQVREGTISTGVTTFVRWRSRP